MAIKPWKHSTRDLVKCDQLIKPTGRWPTHKLPVCNRVKDHDGPCRQYNRKTFKVEAEQPQMES